MREALTSLILLASLAPAEIHARAELTIQPGVAKPGDPVLITVRNVPRAPSGTLGERRLSFYEVPGGHQAISGLSTELALGTLPVKVYFASEADAGMAMEPDLWGELEVVDAKFPARELTVDNKFIEPPPKVKRRIAEDRKAFNKAWEQPFTPKAFMENFVWPRPSTITARFGDRRLFNGKQQSQHYGTDLDGRVGEEIFASNDGKVVMARDCYSSGQTILLYHGANLFTAYFHLSRMDVKQGATVRKGQKLGLVGKTGRVTGPHLHWGVKVDGMYVNGESLVSLDFQ